VGSDRDMAILTTNRRAVYRPTVWGGIMSRNEIEKQNHRLREGLQIAINELSYVYHKSHGARRARIGETIKLIENKAYYGVET
jgi:hypothetical protein